MEKFKVPEVQSSKCLKFKVGSVVASGVAGAVMTKANREDLLTGGSL